MTPLETITEKLLGAIAARDFDQLERTAEERGQLLAGGAEISPRAWALGDEACRALTSLKQQLVIESSRLEQIRRLGASVPPQPSPGREYIG